METILALLLKISPALEAGQSLENAKCWSNVAQASHAVVAIFGFILVAAKAAGFNLPISDDQLAALAGAVAGIGGTVAAYFHVATTPDKGIVRSVQQH